MSHSTTQFITQMKLRELRRQRAKLREAYEGLRGEVAYDSLPRQLILTDQPPRIPGGSPGRRFLSQADGPWLEFLS